MNLSEINWDVNAVGTWPVPIKAAAILLICAVTAVGGFYLDTVDQLNSLDAIKHKEQELKTTFEMKQKKAVNLQDYQKQLSDIESSLEVMIRQMPTEEEVASLLIDISQTGLASGLEFKLFKPSGPVKQEFYSELPISIQVIGKYEELGLFVSGLASLPRIVTVHDVNMVPQGKEGAILMNATVKTYNEGSIDVGGKAGVKTVNRKRAS
jgi:type IV pilus assembly protein PilO